MTGRLQGTAGPGVVGKRGATLQVVAARRLTEHDPADGVGPSRDRTIRPAPAVASDQLIDAHCCVEVEVVVLWSETIRLG